MTLTRAIPYFGLLFLVLVIAAFGYKIGQGSRNDEVADLSLQLAKSAETLEIANGLYARQAGELVRVEVILDSSRAEVKLLKEHLKKSGAELLTAQQLTLKWKRAYEAEVEAHQTEEPGPDGDPPRKRVDFAGDLGPIHVTGHTLTDPPVAHIKLEQVMPLTLTVAVAQNKDGSWSSFVTSSDENIDVKVDLAGVSPQILSPKWYQKIWVEAGASVLGDPAGSISTMYAGDRYMFGISCYATNTGAQGCGGTIGFRPFK